MKITREFIHQGKSKAGGWSRDQVREIGISWPLKTGWIDRSIGQEISDEQAEMFLRLKDCHLPETE